MSDIGFEMEQRGHRGRRRRGRSRRAGCLAVLVSLVVLGGLGAFAVLQGRAYLEDLFAPPPDYQGPGTGSVLVEVQEGDTSTDIAMTLAEADVVASAEAFTDAAREEPRATLIQVGFYDMARKMRAEDALQRMLDPEAIVTNAVTIPEGFTVEEIVARVAEDTELRKKRLAAVAKRARGLGLPDYAPADVEGYLFPATYSLPPDVTPRQMLRQMVDRFREAASSANLQQRASQVGLSPAEVVTVASIVQREARNPEDFPKVARVIYNRLENGMRLQMDSTVHYAVGKRGEVATSDEDRASRSPYNTYRHTGLPPGPIASPGDDALEAALEPAEGDWVYFVTVDIDTGETKFAETDAQHQRNVAELREFCSQSPKC